MSEDRREWTDEQAMQTAIAVAKEHYGDGAISCPMTVNATGCRILTLEAELAAARAELNAIALQFVADPIANAVGLLDAIKSMQIERDKLRAEVEALRPVVEAARTLMAGEFLQDVGDKEHALCSLPDLKALSDELDTYLARKEQ